MHEYQEVTIKELCLDYCILFYEEDVLPFAWAEGWFYKAPVICDDDIVDFEIKIDVNAINDTLDRMALPVLVEECSDSTVLAKSMYIV